MDASDNRPPIYLDNAATTYPKPPQVVAAVRASLDQSLTVQRSTHAATFRGDEVLRRARAKLARFTGARFPEEIVYTYSATDGLNIALHGLIRPGSHVLTTPLEHHSVMRVLHAMRERNGVSWTVLPADADGVVDPAGVAACTTANTTALVVNWISNVSGTIQPVAELGQAARAHGLAYIVDAAQATGSHAVNVLEVGCDAMAQPGHKALMSLPGTGVLYVRREADLLPWRIGGTGYRSELEIQPEERPMRFEAGTPNVPGIVGLDVAMDWFEEVGGVSVVEQRCASLTQYLSQRLAALDGVSIIGSPSARRGNVVSFTIDAPDGSVLDPLLISAVLSEQFGISSRAGLHCAPTAHRYFGTYDRGGAVRFSVSWFTEEWMLDAAVAAVEAVRAGLA